MNILQAGILGIVEGLTEFLPISSTFHLIWSARLLGLTQTEFLKLFEVVIQSGAILAIVVIYVQTVLHDLKLIKNLFISFVPTAVIGLLLYKVIKNSFFDNFILQLVIFIGVGIFFILFEKWSTRHDLHRKAENLTTKEAVFVGVAQALAVFPGVSRAGAVMIALMYRKISRVEAAKYSFLLAVPTLLAASVLDLFKSRNVLFQNSQNIPLLAVGFLFSFVSAFVVVKWFIAYLQSHNLTNFGWYRIIAGTLLFITK